MRMRSLIALPAAFVTVVVGCGRDPRGAGATAPVDPRTATSMAATAPGASSDPTAVGDGGITSATAPSVSSATTGSSAPPPAPIDGQLPATDALLLSTKASCPAKICRLEGSLLEALLGTPENRAPAAIWEEDLGAGAAVTFARRADLDILGVTLTGNIALSADEQKAGATELTTWHAFVAPGGGIALRAKGPARVVLIVVTAGDPVASKGAATKTSPWTARPAPIVSVDLARVPDLAWGKGAYHARIGLAAEASPRASLGILKMSPDGVVPPHEHANEWEHMAILQGVGDFVQGTGENEHTLHATSGVIFSVPPATRHTWRSAGSKEFLGIQLYTPPGPEQRFKKLAASP
jgi:mannose-6-phosphate isomerase-like protein (cupin superfamily)